MIHHRVERSVVSTDQLFILGPAPTRASFSRPADDVAPRVVVADAAENFQRRLFVDEPLIVGVVGAVLMQRRFGRHSFRADVDPFRDHRAGDVRSVLLIRNARAQRIARAAALEVNVDAPSELDMRNVSGGELEVGKDYVFSGEVVLSRQPIVYEHMARLHRHGSRGALVC